MTEEQFHEQETSLTDLLRSVGGSLGRRRWWVMATAVVVPLLAIGILLSLPDVYSSEATLVVAQQRVPERFVTPFRTRSSVEELNAAKVEVLSRKRVIEIVETLNLYPDLRPKRTPDEIVEVMRKDVKIEPIESNAEVTAFKVSYAAGTPALAQSVTNRLAALFIEENARTQGGQIAVTAKFLDEQLNAAKQRLTQQEERLRNYKMSNLGALPEQQQINQGALSDLRIRLQDVTAGLSRARQQRIYWESLLNGKIAALQSERTTLLNRFTPQHREVVKKDEAIAATEAFLAQLRTGRIPPGGFQSSLAADDPLIAQLQGQIEANFTETEELQRTEQGLRAQSLQYQGRLNSAPIKEQELATIQRDYETYKKDYQDILDRQLNSRLSASLEERQEGRHYRLVDPPTLPSTPSSPARVRLSLVAIAVGLVLGLVIGIARDQMDGVFRAEQEIRSQFDVPVVVGIPVISTPAEDRLARRRRAFEWFAAVGAILVIAAAESFVVMYR